MSQSMVPSEYAIASCMYERVHDDKPDDCKDYEIEFEIELPSGLIHGARSNDDMYRILTPPMRLPRSPSSIGRRST
ncbi:hypothetical protein CYMTET_44257 [Cymbomonas tetramitiformis]|uniref:Uncharacterized protein n=1 Tax=Cymbomonas tetramitiformis TaxID=36881 RepID=A0AAE0EZS8_9CHLO|nr:hypothetical protein CYMTET_44257 [Cymbomonas tetramitiformis]